MPLSTTGEATFRCLPLLAKCHQILDLSLPPEHEEVKLFFITHPASGIMAQQFRTDPGMTCSVYIQGTASNSPEV